MSSLSPELLDLMEHEKAIEQSLDEIGWHLEQIRDARTFAAAGYPTFGAYCEGRWHHHKSWAYRMIAGAEIRRELSSPNGDAPAPKTRPVSEAQTRPLATLRDDPDEMRAAWDEAVAEADGHQPTALEVTHAVHRRREPQVLPKPDVGGGVAHPARFSDPLIPIFASLLPPDRFPTVLDPFAGTGRIHELANNTVGIELEPEWADLHPCTICGEAIEVMRDDGISAHLLPVDAVCTSPTFGNRLADHHQASDPESRRSYTHDLGRPLTEGNSGEMQWGETYRAFHRDAWSAAVSVLRPGGRFVLDIKDHVRGGEVQPVTLWHVATLSHLGLVFEGARQVDVPNLRQGANPERCPEWVVWMVKP